MTEKQISEYDHIDFRINIMYDAIYNKDTSSHYMIKPIVKNSISLIDIKEPEYFNPSNVFEGKIVYTGKYNNKWVFKRSSETSHSCSLSIGEYSSGNPNDLTRSELYNPAMHYMISELAMTEDFKHVLLPIIFY